MVGLSEVEPTILVAFVEGRVNHFQFGDTAVLVFLVGHLQVGKNNWIKIM